ncbi:putative kinesin light chain [Microdochium trichocladiopsis]|uniref:Kinesin light chain n=1 Tax=Microdochium trichocladiopsis TaxID=1682393 RepID=A0A9P8Y5B4_9PEZI|nr:putative kinesin light chain [Microdochium trichocladiopsis]KAH7029852.1 putative kinesin light chain [Microdochium trichocladiopsis]
MVNSVAARDFTVGWVCALPIELAAAVQMMDEQFADLPSFPTDSNLYSFGRIGVHNVVAASLPAGQMGTNQAAVVASQMRLNFPSLRFGVLVGIAGGVPNSEEDIDIRLGDVVISQPFGRHGGVVQYDFGKTGPGGSIARTGTLNTPPTILLNALAKLRAKDLLSDTRVLDHLSKISSSPKFASPGPTQDVLFHASSLHLGGATCAECRPADIVIREPRSTTDPALFFGTIASGNQVMRDGVTRDRYSQDLGGVLCFEMEAAGLMNNLPCLVVRGICDYADAHKNKLWQPYAAATAAAVTKELLSIVPPLAAKADSHSIETARAKRHFFVPFGQNENFVGREDILQQLLERIHPTAFPNTCQRTVIEGLGGMGKTQVAIESAYRVREAHPDCSVFWVPAVDMVVFENAYREIGLVLGVEGVESEGADVKTMVKSALSGDDAGQWLLVVDNADDIVLMTDGRLQSYLPMSRQGSILFTTRNHHVASRLAIGKGLFRLQPLDGSESAQLLHQGLQTSQIGDPQSTMDLLDFLASLPLAIRQASAYMASNAHVTVARYLGYCTSSDQTTIKLLSKDFDAQDRYEASQNPVATTWLISFEQVALDSPLAARYLRSICYFEEKDIPLALLAAEGDEMERDEALSTLKAYAFIKDRENPDRFDIHRLVRLTMRNWLQSRGEQSRQVTEVTHQLWMVFPVPSLGNREVWTAFLPHAHAALVFRNECTDKMVVRMLQDAMGLCYLLLRKFHEAEKMLRTSPELLETLFGPGHKYIDDTRNHHAFALSRIGKYEEAEQIYRQVLQDLESALSQQDPTTLDCMVDLGRVLGKQGKYEEAEQIHKTVVELQKHALGREGPAALASMRNWALLLSEQERFEEAEPMMREVVQQSEELMGSEDLVVLMRCHDLADVLARQGKYEEADQILSKTLASMNKVQGPEDPQTLDIMESFAGVLRSQGRYEEAEQMFRQVLVSMGKVLGPEHPEALNITHRLAMILYEQGKYEEAALIYKKILSVQTPLLGVEHPDTLRTIGRLRLVLTILGKDVAAEDIH